MNETIAGSTFALIAAFIMLLSAIPIALTSYAKDEAGLEAISKLSGNQQPVMHKHYSGAKYPDSLAHGVVSGHQIKLLVESQKYAGIKVRLGNVVLDKHNQWGEHTLLLQRNYSMRWQRDPSGELIAIEYRILPLEGE
jgi:hypothetical protein